jgi:cytochrome c oxidase assembly protein subunit 15
VATIGKLKFSRVKAMPRPELALSRYLRVCQIAYLALFAIIVTGSLVRLTGSGLGCVDWPACNSAKFVDVSSTHAAIEQVNRLFTGFVTIAVMAAVGLSLFLQPRIRALTMLSWGLVAGVLAQIIIGGIVVLTGLNPYSNILHFLVSIVLMTNAVVLIHRVRQEIDVQNQQVRPPPSLSNGTRKLRFTVVALCGLSIVLGTVVTGAGPHAGDEDAIRLGLSISWAARLHSSAVWCCLLAAVVLFFRIRTLRSEYDVLGHSLQVFLFWCISQGLLGYLQYFSGVPAPLVALHIAGSVMVWVSVLQLQLSTHSEASV